MKRLLLVCAVTILAASPARAQVFGQFTPAQPITGNGNLFGVYLLLGDHNTGLLGQVRFTSTETFNWGLQAGFSDPEGPGDAAVLLGGDFRYQLHKSDESLPLDLAFNGAAGLTTADNLTVLDIAPGLLYSHRFPLRNTNGAISPYGSLLMLIEHADEPGPGNGGTDVNLVARFGGEWEAAPRLRLLAELEVGNGTEFNTGVSIPF